MTASQKIAKISVGDRVMVYFPFESLGKAYKFCRPFHEPYRVDKVFPNGAEVISLSGNKTRTIRIALDRVRRCPKELGDRPEDSSFDGLKEMCEDNSVTEETECSEDMMSLMQTPTLSGKTGAETGKKKPETSRVRCSQRIRKKKPMS